MSLAPGTSLGPYEIVRQLGSGGMGVVYTATDPRLKRTVAIKLLPPDLTRDETAKQRFLQEAKVASALDHPNICTIFEINETPDGQLYLVMAHYEGETLKERIERHRDLHMSLCSFLVSSGSSCHRAVRTRAVAVMVLLLALLPSGLLAQPPPQRPTFRAGIDLIEIDVTVVNGQGVPVKDLRAPEFTVSVDGQPRSVVTAEFIDLRAETPEGRPASADAGEGFYSSNTAATRGRLIVLMIDRENMIFGAGSNVTRAAARFVEKLTSNDRVELVTLPRPGPLVDFTANHDLVRDAVDGLVGLGQPPLGLLNIGMQEALTLGERWQRQSCRGDAHGTPLRSPEAWQLGSGSL